MFGILYSKVLVGIGLKKCFAELKMKPDPMASWLFTVITTESNNQQDENSKMEINERRAHTPMG